MSPCRCMRRTTSISRADGPEGLREKSRIYLYDCVKAAVAIGAARVVFHAGTCDF